MLAFMAFAAPSYAFTISIDAPQNVETGSTFTLTADVANDYGAAAGSDTSPLIATLLSSNNCIINSAKILGTFHAGEIKQASWVITAPGAGVCVFSVSVGTFTKIYAQQNAAVSVISPKDSASSAAAGGGMGGGTNEKSASPESSAASETAAKKTPPPDFEEGGEGIESASSAEQPLEIDTENLAPFASAGIAVIVAIAVATAFRARKKRDPWSR